MLHILLFFFSFLSHYFFPIYLKLFISIFILPYSFITHILSFTFHITTYIFLTSYHFYVSFYISLIPSSYSTPLLMVNSFEECTWFDGKFTNFVRIWAYEQPLCSNIFVMWISILVCLFYNLFCYACWSHITGFYTLKWQGQTIFYFSILAFFLFFFPLPEDLYLLSLFEP